MKTKKCCSCKKEKKLNKFYKHPHAKYERQSECIDCRKQTNKRFEYKTKEQKIHARKRRNKQQREKYNKNIDFKLKMLYRNRIYCALKDNVKSNTTENLLGCSINKLKQYLEEQFKEGMNWDNYGEWHVDHIKPCASFDLTDKEQQKECFHYTNLQPLWAEENYKKHAKIC